MTVIIISGCNSSRISSLGFVNLFQLQELLVTPLPQSISIYTCPLIFSILQLINFVVPFCNPYLILMSVYVFSLPLTSTVAAMSLCVRIAQSVRWLASSWIARVQLLAGAETFLLATMSTLTLRPTQPIIRWVKQAECDASHSSSFGTELSMCEIVPPHHLYTFLTLAQGRFYCWYDFMLLIGIDGWLVGRFGWLVGWLV